MESLKSKSILKHMKVVNFYDTYATWFLSKSFTLAAQLSCCNDCFKAVDNGNSIDVISLDYSKAFDSVCHRKLLHKFKQYNFNNKMCAWMKSFLSDKEQCVKIGDMLSSWSPVISGVPQRSICGPLMFNQEYIYSWFNIFVNDMPSVVQFNKIIMYADDARLYVTGDVVNARHKLTVNLA